MTKFEGAQTVGVVFDRLRDAISLALFSRWRREVENHPILDWAPQQSTGSLRISSSNLPCYTYGQCVLLLGENRVMHSFLGERCNCIASSAIPIRCLSSVTRVNCYKTPEARIIQFLLECSPMPYLFACQVWLQNSTWVPMIGGSNWGGVVSDFAMLYMGDSAR